MKTTGASYSMTANHFGISISEPSQIGIQNFFRDGVGASFRAKGRPQHPMTKVKHSQRTKSINT